MTRPVLTLRPTRRLLPLFAAALLAACSTPEPAPLDVATGLVLRNATVVDTRTGQLAAGMNVIVNDGRIVAVTSQPVRAAAGVQNVDATGRFVVPGYQDMHTHALPRGLRQPSVWPLFVAHGITGVREMAGGPELIRAARALNTESAAGRVVAPEIVAVPGPLFVGAPNAAAATALVGQNKAMGADFVKVVAGSREASLAMLQAARAQQLPVAGHMPLTVSTEEASTAGLTAIEHLGAGLGLMLDCTPNAAAIRQSVLQAAAAGGHSHLTPEAIQSPMLSRASEAPFYRQVMAAYDPARCLALARHTAAAGTWQVPTLIRLHTMMNSDARVYRDNPALVYVDAATRTLWEGLAQRYAQQVPADAAKTFRDFYELQKKALPLFKQAGVKMLAGTDYGGIWVTPGASLQQEFAELASAGLTPLDVLQMTTLNAAEFLGRSNRMGTVEAGKDADLVILGANPITDVAHLARIDGVVLNGRHFSAQDLQRMKDEAAAAVR